MVSSITIGRFCPC